MAMIIVTITAWTGSRPDPAVAADIRTRAEEPFDALKQQDDRTRTANSTSPTPRALPNMNDTYPSERYWVGKGQGDLAKGRLVCQRVSELSARTDLAKQIRVMVKEHMIDRVRERSGHTMDQDIELTREEVVQEYLLGATIVDRQVDEEHKVCTATAVMLKSPLPPKASSDAATAPASSR